jgi:ABC-type phosphate transport system permease subunit
VKFRVNSIGFWKKFRWMIIVFFIALLCDALSTVHFMRHTGPEAELHPGVQFMSELCGPVAGPLIGMILKATAGIAVAIYLRKYAGVIFFTGSVLSFWAAWYNLWGCDIYVPYILTLFNF